MTRDQLIEGLGLPAGASNAEIQAEAVRLGRAAKVGRVSEAEEVLAEFASEAADGVEGEDVHIAATHWLRDQGLAETDDNYALAVTAVSGDVATGDDDDELPRLAVALLGGEGDELPEAVTAEAYAEALMKASRS